MRIQVTTNIDEAIRGLKDIEKKAVKPAAMSAMRNAIKYSEVRAVRWVRKRLSERGLKLKNKDIRKKDLVYMIRPSFYKGAYLNTVRKGSLYDGVSGVVYINEFGSRMSTRHGFTESDANSWLASPATNEPVTGRAFKFIGRKSGSEMWGKRHPTIRYSKKYGGHVNKWRSSKVIALYYKSKIEGSERAAKVIAKMGARQFKRRFRHHLSRKLQRLNR